MKSKCLIIFALTILILSIGAVSASDLNQTDTIQANENTFQDIQDTINNASDNDVIYLEGTYTGNGDKITLDKPLTITSKNKATLNANGLSQIFDVNANNVIFKNINFINGKSEYGGAIQFKGCNYTIDNCIFTNNNADYGGAVTLEGSNVEVLNSIFVNNKAKSSYNFASGGAIHGLLKNSLISGCTFKSNYASGYGGAIAISTDSYCKNNTIKKSTFIKNSAEMGGALSMGAGNVAFCIFDSNTDRDDSKIELKTFAGTAFYGKATLNNNFWGFNIKSYDDFINNNLISAKKRTDIVKVS